MDDPDLLETDLDASVQFLIGSRFWIQKVLVPLTVLIGVSGNIITVMVLTRRRMRCTTTIYLTALAIADIIYLLFVLLLSFEKYDRIHEQRFELYWRFFGISHWICDAASSTSVWLTVSFTIERYIVVCHPIKGKVHCTEARAKSIITIVSILCLLSTASTTFEYQLKVDEKCTLRKHCAPPNNATITDDNIDYERHADECALLATPAPSVELAGRNVCCAQTVYTIGTEPTSLARNGVYTSAFYWFSAIGFGLLPLALIATFNMFLVHAVYRSQKWRRTLTSVAENCSQNNENRITLLLIGVVILFLICQTPTAVYLIYAAFNRTESDFAINIEKGLGNIFNYLLTLNAACNFILFCVLSAKFRRTFRLVFCQRKGGQGRAHGNTVPGTSVIRNNNRRRHLGRNDSTTYNENSSRGGGNIYSGASNYATIERFSHVSEQLSEEDEEKENAEVEKCNGGSMGGRETENNEQMHSAHGRSVKVRQPMLKTPRNIETLSLNSIPRSRPMLMRPIGKARSTDLVA